MRLHACGALVVWPGMLGTVVDHSRREPPRKNLLGRAGPSYNLVSLLNSRSSHSTGIQVCFSNGPLLSRQNNNRDKPLRASRVRVGRITHWLRTSGRARPRDTAATVTDRYAARPGLRRSGLTGDRCRGSIAPAELELSLRVPGSPSHAPETGSELWTLRTQRAAAAVSHFCRRSGRGRRLRVGDSKM